MSAMILNPPLSRRRFMQGLALGGAVVSMGLGRVPVYSASPTLQPVTELRNTDVQLNIGRTLVNFTGRARQAITVNHSLPAPTLRWRQGDTVTIRVSNSLPDEMTSIHWHGILLPANMDGVPGFSFNGIAPSESYLYQFQLKQSGTYWYHSHSMFQEQVGLYGALIIDPIEPPPYKVDREHVILFSDWTDLNPAALFRRMKKMAMHDNFYQPTAGDFVRDIRRNGLSETLADRGMWGRMRMTPSDISDINAHTYTYLLNGQPAASPWTGLFQRGEKVLLRMINGSAMTHFDVRIPGLKLTVVAADGQYVHPVTVDELRIAVAETFDVIIEPNDDVFTLFAQDMGRTGYVCGTLAVAAGLKAEVPALDPRPLLLMSDMGPGHAMHGNNHGAQQTDHSAHAAHAHHGSNTHSDHTMPTPAHGSHAMGAAAMPSHPLIDMRSGATQARLDDPGIGLRDNGRRVLTYADLHSQFADPDGREPEREITLHLTGHMEKFAWGFDGIPFAGAEPIRLKYGERMRMVLVNDTMMTHPVHLHGVWSDLENAQGEFQLRKHTIDILPGTRRSFRVRADAAGRWAFHCHLLYHMEAGMMREVRIEA